MSNEPAPLPKSDELALLEQQDTHQFEYANRQLEANLQNERERREHVLELTKSNNRAAMTVLILGLVLFFGFGFFALWLGKEAFLSDMMKVIVGAIGGGGIGFYFGTRHKQNG